MYNLFNDILRPYVNRVKDELKLGPQAKWIVVLDVCLRFDSTQVQEHLRNHPDGTKLRLNIDFGMKVIKPQLSKWVAEAVTWFGGADGCKLILKGWELSGILKAWQKSTQQEAQTNQVGVEVVVFDMPEPEYLEDDDWIIEDEEPQQEEWEKTARHMRDLPALGQKRVITPNKRLAPLLSPPCRRRKR